MSFKRVGYDGYEYVSDPPTEADIEGGRIWAKQWRRCEHGRYLKECELDHQSDKELDDHDDENS